MLVEMTTPVKLVGVRTVEPLVDYAEMARILGVSESTLAQFVREGCPSETWGLRLRRFQPSEVRAWAKQRGRRAA